jgi:hypothetical protein
MPLLITIAAVLVVVATSGYWWLNRPPDRYRPDNGGLYLIENDGKFGFMDRTGTTVIEPQFEEVGAFSEGLAAVRVGTKWGYINAKGELVINPQFDHASSFQYGRAVVKLCCGNSPSPGPDSRFGFIDKNGQYIGNPDLRKASSFSGGMASVVTVDGQAAFVSRSGETLMLGKFDAVKGFHGGLAPASTGGKWGFVDGKGDWKVDPQFEFAEEFSEGLAAVEVGGRTGYVDRTGKFVINPQYERTGSEGFVGGYSVFSPLKDAGSDKSPPYGVIDRKGRIVVQPKFEHMLPLVDEFASVMTTDGWGIIDMSGRFVVKPEFDFAGHFQNGLAPVSVLGKLAYVTTTGEFVVDPFPGMTVAQAKARPVEVTQIVGEWRDEGGNCMSIESMSTDETQNPNDFWVDSWTCNNPARRMQVIATLNGRELMAGGGRDYTFPIQVLWDGTLVRRIEISLGEGASMWQSSRFKRAGQADAQ